MKKTFLILLAMLVALFLAPNAFAVSFGDTSIYWPSWSNGTVDDFNDTIGGPQFSGGDITYSGGFLTSVTIDYEYWNNANVDPGDLFIDLGADSNWDWIAVNATINTGSYSYKLYQVSGTFAEGSSYYRDSDGLWGSGSYRERHPVAVDFNFLAAAGVSLTDMGFITFSGLDLNSSTSGSLLFSLGQNISVASIQDIIIGFSPTCANDVIYEGVSVPEPSLMLLLGAGFIVIAGLGRLRFLKKN